MLKLVALACLALLAHGALVVPPVGTIPDKHYIPRAPPVNREARDVCVYNCLNTPPSLVTNPDTVLRCIKDCVDTVMADMSEWITNFPTGEAVPLTARRDHMTTLYRDGVVLQNQLMALRRMVETPGTLWDFFPHFPNFGFGFHRPQQQGFAANAPAPQHPGLLVQIIQTITNLLTQVIKKQQEILQMIIGCTCNAADNSTTVAPPVTAPPVTAPPVTAPPVTTPPATTPPPAVRLDAAPLVTREDVPEDPSVPEEPLEPTDPPAVVPPPIEPIDPVQPIVPVVVDVIV